jgi:hypothetical protein
MRTKITKGFYNLMVLPFLSYFSFLTPKNRNFFQLVGQTPLISFFISSSFYTNDKTQNNN